MRRIIIAVTAALAVVIGGLSATAGAQDTSSAAGFYTRAGFMPRGEPFEEAGIAHLEMVRAL